MLNRIVAPWARRLLLLVLGLYGLAVAAMVIAQDYLLFAPDRGHSSPQDIGLAAFSEDKIQTRDGETLVIWRKQAAQERPTLLFLHGKGGGLRGRRKIFTDLTADGLGLIAVEWRGYGASSGAPSEAGLQADAQAAYFYARDHGVPPDKLFIMGESLGTGVALWLAAHEPVAGVVLDSPYSSIIDVAADRYWMFPVRALSRHVFDARQWISQVKRPILALHGDADASIPLALGQRLMSDADPAKDKLIVFPGAPHVIARRADGVETIRAWIGAQSARQP